MEIDLSKVIKNVSKIKLKGGIFAKTCTVLIIVALSMLGISLATNNIWIRVAALSMIFILTFVILWRLINFANKNPQAAILEGAEFLIHEELQLAAKGIPNLPQSLSIYMEDKPVQITGDDIKKLDAPDEGGEEGEVENG